MSIQQIELQAKLLNYFLGSNKSNINQALPLNGFGYDRDEELQDAGGGLRNSCLAVVGMRVSYYGCILIQNLFF